MRTQPASLLSRRVVVAATGALVAVVAAGAIPPPVRGALGAGPAALPRLGVSMGSPSSEQAKSSSSPESQETQPGKQHQQRRVQGYTLSPEKAQQAEAFARARRRLHSVGFFYGVCLYPLVLRVRIVPKCRDCAERT